MPMAGRLSRSCAGRVGGQGTVGKVQEYREVLRRLDSWDAFLLEESRLPGLRANLELARAAALEGSAVRMLR